MLFLKKLLGVIIILLGSVSVSLGQFTVTSPLNRAVYQRNNAGVATITVSGTYEQQVDRIEARLIAINTGQGNPGEWSDWKTLKDFPTNGGFSSSMTINQGWYRMEIRGVLNNNVVGNITSVDRFGVGEVFIIAGQSNAEGLFNMGQQGAQDDRVNTFGNANDQINGGTSYATLSPFTQLSADTYIAPRGKGAYCWGKLGDLLAARLNVPILFLNAGFNGTSIDSWFVTSIGGSAYNIYLGGYYPNQLPYSSLESVLHYFVPLLGARSILWCQGETDNFPYKTSQFDYTAKLQVIISKTREHLGKNIAWVISQTSASVAPNNCNPSNASESWEPVLAAQRTVASSMTNAFLGPYTDNIQNPGRSDCLHFYGDGLLQLGQAWSNSLNDSFFQNSVPQAPTVQPQLSFACGNNTLDVTMPSGYNQYQWSRSVNFESAIFSTQQKVTLSNGTYYARAIDSRGNVMQFSPILVRTTSPQTVTTNPSGTVGVCQNDGLTVSASNGVAFRWSTGASGQSISLNNAGNYTVTAVDNFGCLTQSAPLTTFMKASPAQPTVSANSALEFCADSQVTLTSSGQNLAYRWSTGSTSAAISVNQSGAYTVQTINSEGCSSFASNAVVVKVNPLPTTPNIVPNGPTTFCSDTSVDLISSNTGAVSYKWNTGTTTRTLNVRQSGNYTVQTVDAKGCFSLSSSPLTIKVNQIPATPITSWSKDTVFCDGDNTVLQMALANGNYPTWVAVQGGKTAQYLVQNLNVTLSGTFKAFQTDNNNCNSALSSPIYVAVKPTPAKVSVDEIVRYSPYSIGVANPQTEQYIWTLNGTQLDGSTSQIKLSDPGDVQVTAKKLYSTLSYGTKFCLSPVSDRKNIQLYEDGGFSVYPNPSNGAFTLDTRYPWANLKVEVYTNRGSLVYASDIATFETKKDINLTQLPEGPYLIRIRNDNFTATKHVQINR
ncbi:T9SS type A sorting domain-containing protein [Cellulophaga sp. BC115SP]|uniref:T9SS type A sorting domain-containing protein n=1 Tax=Cellulophaga sp. BC115SP TaxID=2683263 RepID=UPI00141266FC|nr:T9SS type A sorting domain-containing protein [Cellulophaga sp. BC115SP]NBB28390.1 T9SS type A sorting domain-containing protein [Cellulophaga sp. BC115SP]